MGREGEGTGGEKRERRKKRREKEEEKGGKGELARAPTPLPSNTPASLPHPRTTASV